MHMTYVHTILLPCARGADTSAASTRPLPHSLTTTQRHTPHARRQSVLRDTAPPTAAWLVQVQLGHNEHAHRLVEARADAQALLVGAPVVRDERLGAQHLRRTHSSVVAQVETSDTSHGSTESVPAVGHGGMAAWWHWYCRWRW